MRANLSIVLDKDKKVRLDLLKNLPLSEIDQYTIEKSSSLEIREEYASSIANFLEENRFFIDTFKKEGNKQGSLVIVYEDEKKKLHRMRVLYKENSKKLDPSYLIKCISKVISKMGNPDFTIAMMENFSFFLGSPFNIQKIKTVQRHYSTDERVRKNQNQNLWNIVRRHIYHAFDTDFEKGHFYLRLIDAYIENQGFETTRRVYTSKKGKIEVAQLPKEKIAFKKDSIPQPTIIKKEPEEEKQEKDLFPMDDDGQYSLFTLPSSPYTKYERFLEEEEDKKRGHKK